MYSKFNMKIDQPANNNSLNNISLPFSLEESGIPGNFIRMNDEVDKILRKHKYPIVVSKLLGELLILTSMLGTTLKLDGILSIQAQGDGIIGFISADYNSKGHIRGYAHVNDKDKIKKIKPVNRKKQDITELFGKGNIVITIENKNDKPYQAIVPLEGQNLSLCIMDYLRYSSQLHASIKVTTHKVHKKWHAAGIMLQYFEKPNTLKDELDENFNRASILMESATEKELVDDNLPIPTLLFRLFNEDGVRIYEHRKLEAHCRCSRERMLNALKMLGKEELKNMKIKDKITLTCQFCNNKEKFEEGDVIGEF